MTDLYLSIADQPEDVLDAIAASMDVRAGEAAMQDICRAYLAPLASDDLDVLEIGCGNGAASTLMLDILKPRHFLGVDPSAGLIRRAETRFDGQDHVRFHVGTAESTGAKDDGFDLVVAHTVFSHLAHPETALQEAMRVLRPGGVLAVFDGDYATNTVALFAGDPLQAAMEATQRNLIHDPYVMRRLPALMTACGFTDPRMQAHGYVQTARPDYIITLMQRGVTAATGAGECGDELANAFVAEAQRRVDNRTFYGAILFASVTARKPMP